MDRRPKAGAIVAQTLERLAHRLELAGVLLIPMPTWPSSLRTSVRRSGALWTDADALRKAGIERWNRLTERLPAVVRGDDRPSDANELLAFAVMCCDKKLHASAVRLYAAGLSANPTLADDRQAQYAYNAACARLLPDVARAWTSRRARQSDAAPAATSPRLAHADSPHGQLTTTANSDKGTRGEDVGALEGRPRSRRSPRQRGDRSSPRTSGRRAGALGRRGRGHAQSGGSSNSGFRHAENCRPTRLPDEPITPRTMPGRTSLVMHCSVFAASMKDRHRTRSHAPREIAAPDAPRHLRLGLGSQVSRPNSVRTGQTLGLLNFP